jgi:hypothetical protein
VWPRSERATFCDGLIVLTRAHTAGVEPDASGCRALPFQASDGELDLDFRSCDTRPWSVDNAENHEGRAWSALPEGQNALMPGCSPNQEFRVWGGFSPMQCMPAPGMSHGLTTGVSPVGIGSLQAVPARFHPSVSHGAGAVPASLPQNDIYNVCTFSSVQPSAPSRDDKNPAGLSGSEFHAPGPVFRSPAPGLGYTSNSGSLQTFGSLQPRSIARSFADGPQHDLHQPAFTPPTAKTPTPR